MTDLSEIWGVKEDSEIVAAAWAHIADKVVRARERGNRVPNIANAFRMKNETVEAILEGKPREQCVDHSDERILEHAAKMGWKNPLIHLYAYTH